MKKLFFLCLSTLFVLSNAIAQDPAKDLKDAKKAYNTFTLDQANKPKLKEAQVAIDQALKAAENQALADAWITQGKIYNDIATQIVNIRSLNIGKLDELPQVELPAVVAAKAYTKALELAQKKFETKDALTGLAAVQANLSNLGIYLYEEQKYQNAYESFKTALDVHELLKKNAQKSSLDAEADYNNQIYITGLAALSANLPDIAKPYFEQLYKINYDKASIYEALYTLTAKTDMNEAYKYLEAGRAKYPEETSLLFADINHYLKLGKLDQLIDKLKMGIAKEPNNVGLYTVMGSVYDNLYQKSEAAGDKAKSDEYFNESLNYYNQGIAKDPKNVDAIYSIGALYYNRAAVLTQKLNKLADDYSKDGLKKYQDMRAQVFEQFEKALPFFKKAENLDPNDTNTLIALKEIYAKKDQLDISKALKERLENVQAGKKNDKPYFNE